MSFNIKMGVPEMFELWNNLLTKFRTKTITKKDELVFKKWGSALKKLSEDPFYPALHTHEIPQLTKRYKIKVWQSYLENKTSGAMRMYWVYGPDNQVLVEKSVKGYKEIEFEVMTDSFVVI